MGERAALRIISAGVDQRGATLANIVSNFMGPFLPATDLLVVHAEDELTNVVEGILGLHNVGGAILCLTPTSLSERLEFLAGFLHGIVGPDGFVAPLLLDMTPQDISPTPMGIFQ